MFLLRGTKDNDRSRACTATAEQALRHHDRMTRDGLSPIVTDYNGRRLSLSELEQNTAQPERASHRAQ